VARLSITPVKSMQLQHPACVRLERFGVAEDRRFYVADGEGRLLSGSPHDRLFPVKAEYDPGAERLTLRFPGGGVVEGEVGVVTGLAVNTSFWGRPVAGHEVAGPWTAALSEHVGSAVRLVRADRPGQAVDSHAVSIFSTASAEELDRQAGRSDRPLDRRRWRMLAEVTGAVPTRRTSGSAGG
jgi:MOSC domain-containing protein